MSDGALGGALMALGNSAFALAARVLLAIVLAPAGLGKMLNPSAAADALIGFGILRKHSALAGRCLGLLETVLAGALVLFAGSSAPAVASSVLFSAFAVLVARALRHGQSFNCGCLSTRDDPIDTHTLTRVLGLLALSLIAAAAPAATAYEAHDLMSAAAAAGSTVGIWTMISALVRHLPTWSELLDGEIDWQLAAEYTIAAETRGHS